jgi:hypothetical protein
MKTILGSNPHYWVVAPRQRGAFKRKFIDVNFNFRLLQEHYRQLIAFFCAAWLWFWSVPAIICTKELAASSCGWRAVRGVGF